jgi:hypothetical protein
VSVLDWLKAARTTGKDRADGLARVLYGIALRLTEEPISAEELVARACRICQGRVRVRKHAGSPDFDVIDALYAAQRETHGPPIGPDDIQRALSEPAMESGRRAGLSLGDLASALDQLPSALWHPLWLRDNRGFSYEEIALVLDLSPVDVGKLVSCARRRIVARLRGTTHGLVANVGKISVADRYHSTGTA